MLTVDLVLFNGNVITMDHKHFRAEAVAIERGVFVEVGTNEQILSCAGRNTQKINLERKTVVPGFIDTHVHGLWLGLTSSQINLRQTKSIKEIQQKIKTWTEKVPQERWIVGRGWGQDQLEERRCPSRWDLDEAAPNHPVLLLRVCGHIAVANSKALRLAEINKQTNSPTGGWIDKHPESGVPTGLLLENALNLIFEVQPKADDRTLTKTCLQACKKMVQQGITTVHWIINSTREMSILQELNRRSLLPLRVYLLVPVELLEHLIELGLSTGSGNDTIKVGSVKILADGSLGARTAALKRPYSDAPETKGMLLYSKKKLEELVEKTCRANMQLAIHAIGDATIETVLKTLEKALSEQTPKKGFRHRLEHVSVLNPKLIKKMKEIGVIVSVQPHFVISDFWTTLRLGKARARWTYPFKTLLKEGVHMMGGSDAPVEPVNPILSIYAAVTRRTFPKERLTIDEALRLYTVNAAYGSFEENVKGSIEKGKLADLVVLSSNPYRTAPSQLRKVKVMMTVVGGKIVYAKKPIV